MVEITCKYYRRSGESSRGIYDVRSPIN